MLNESQTEVRAVIETQDVETGVMEAMIALAEHWRLLLLGPLAIGVGMLALSYLIAPVFTARASFIPPPQAQGGAATSALASLGALTGLAGGAGLRTPGDLYVALMQSTTVADRLIDKFELTKVYDKELRVDVRRELARNMHISLGKKDGIVVLELDDESPARAADIANQCVEELRVLTSRLALTEAQQRRAFFEGHLQRAREHLEQAQLALQASGFNQSSLKAEPKAAAEGYARLKAEITAGQARLQTLRSNLTDRAPEVQQQEAALGVLTAQLAQMEQSSNDGAAPDYVGKYREFKYQEALFEQFSRQYELARVDESRDGALQVVDVATPPEKKSAPKRSVLALVATAAGFIVLLAYVLASHHWRQTSRLPHGARQIERLRAALRRR